MPIVQLTDDYLRALKRLVRGQCEAASAHVTESLARGLGYRTHVALQAALRQGAESCYAPFDEAAFRRRIEALGGRVCASVLQLPPLDHNGRYIASLYEKPGLEIIELHPMRAVFRLDGIETVVQIDLENLGDGDFRFHRSHAIHTPVQLGAYYPSRDWDDDPAYALHRAIESLASYHQEAVQKGHRPSRGWLRPMRHAV